MIWMGRQVALIGQSLAIPLWPISTYASIARAMLLLLEKAGLPVQENELMRPQPVTACGTRESKHNSRAAESSLGMIAGEALRHIARCFRGRFTKRAVPLQATKSGENTVRYKLASLRGGMK